MGKGLLLILRGKTGGREVEIERESSEATRSRQRLWSKCVRIAQGPLLHGERPKHVGLNWLSDKYFAGLVKSAAIAASVRGDLSEQDRPGKFSGHLLRAGLASSASKSNSAEMTRHDQRRRERFRVNLTKAAGL